MAFLGAAASPSQLLVTTGSFLAWLLVQQSLAGPLLSRVFGQSLWTSRTAEERHACGISMTCGCYGVAAVSFGLIGLLYPSPSVEADPIYGYSEFVQFAAAHGVGFFLWNILAENSRAWGGWDKFAHHALCIVAHLVSQHPFSPKCLCMLMLFEFSTPPLCAFNVMRWLGLEDTQAYRNFRVAFAVLFFVFRIAFGIPMTAAWYADMYTLATDPLREVHSMAVFNIMLIVPIPFMCLQLWWFRLIARAVLKKGKKQVK